MTLTDQQLGRIARAADTYSIYTRADVLRCAVKGDLASALAIVGSLEGDWRDNPLMTVLREVSEEVAEAKAHADRQCVVTAWNLDGRRVGTTTIDGRRVLDEVAERTRRPEMVGRITITNEAHGCAWTWEAGA